MNKETLIDASVLEDINKYLNKIEEFLNLLNDFSSADENIIEIVMTYEYQLRELYNSLKDIEMEIKKRKLA